MAQNMKLRAIIEADVKGFKKGMTQVSQGFASAGGASGKFASVAKGGMVALTAATLALGAAITVGFVKKAVTAFIEFEDSLTRTASIMGAESLEAIGGLEEEILRLGETTRSTALEVSEAAQILALAGLKEDDLVEKKALEQLNQLSIAAGVDLPTAAGVAISSLKGMGMETEQLSHVNDILLQTMTNSFTSLESLGETMKLLAPTAASTGISLEEAAAAAGALGNAGLQGSMAGTGMRMAINKLIKPTDDARRVIQDLNLQVFTLTPAGNAAKNALVGVQANLDSMKRDADVATLAMKSLTNEMTDMSIAQQRNNIEIMKIRQRAEKMGRDLTDSELSQIDRLEIANTDLNITMSERQLTIDEQKRAQDKLSGSITEQEQKFKDLNQTVGDQTTGLTSLSDVFMQLTAAGATTAQIMEIFGVRGGNAVNAILAQGDAFQELIALNEDATDRTAEMAEMMGGTTKNAVAELQSAFTALLIEVGRQFGPTIKEEIIPALKDFIEAMMPLVPRFLEVAVMIGEILPDLLEAFIPILIMVGDNMENITGLILFLTYALKLWMFFMEPVISLLGHLGGAMKAIEEGDFLGFLGHVLGILGDIALILTPIIRGITAVAQFAGSSMGMGKEGTDRMGDTAKGAAAGAIIGSVVPGVGTVAGGVIGGAIGLGASFMAEGGIVDGPMSAIIGEAGPEAVIPIEKIDNIIASSITKADSGGGKVVINGGIHIGAGNNLSKRDMRDIIEGAMPSIPQRANTGGARGVI